MYLENEYKNCGSVCLCTMYFLKTVPSDTCVLWDRYSAIYVYSALGFDTMLPEVPGCLIFQPNEEHRPLRPFPPFIRKGCYVLPQLEGIDDLEANTKTNHQRNTDQKKEAMKKGNGFFSNGGMPCYFSWSEY